MHLSSFLSPSLIWFLVGVGFILAELAAPGFIIIFFCLGAWMASIAALVSDSLQTQLLVFIIGSLVSLFALRKYAMRTFKGAATDVAAEHTIVEERGNLAQVTKDILPPAVGEIKYKGSFWRATADVKIKVGESVRIVDYATEDRLTYKVAQTGE